MEPMTLHMLRMYPALAGSVTWSLQTHSDCTPMNILIEKLKKRKEKKNKVDELNFMLDLLGVRPTL